MDNILAQEESHTFTVGNTGWEDFDNIFPVDSDDFFKDMADSSGLFDAQPSEPQGINTFLEGVNWEDLGQGLLNHPQSTQIDAVVQNTNMTPLETAKSSMTSISATLVDTESPPVTMIEDNSTSFDDTEHNYSYNYSYPDPLESAISIQGPYFNSSQFVNASQMSNLEGNAAGSIYPGLDFDSSNLFDPGVLASVELSANIPQSSYPELLSYPSNQTTVCSTREHCARTRNLNVLTSSFPGATANQAYWTQSDSVNNAVVPAPAGQHMCNTSLNYPAYTQTESLYPDAQFITFTPPNHQSPYSPYLQASSPAYTDFNHHSPDEDEDVDGDSPEDEDYQPRPAGCAPKRRKSSKEKPQIPKDKPWIRINKETRGGTSRTLKINHYNPNEMYEQLSHPVGTWSVPHNRRRFQYSPHHELAEREMTISRLKQFIQYHPITDDCKLTLYIQRTPADSKRRYASDQTERCRFADCPARIYGNSVASRGLITTGNYRVAFDEFSYGYGAHKGGRADPFKVAFFVHLYCLERFLDFPALCRLEIINVKADSRQAMPTEPNAKFAAALAGSELKIAAAFIEACRSGNLRNPSGEWADYPHHVKIGKELRWKDHYDTLNYRMQSSKNTSRSSKVKKQEKLTNIAMHCGNLDVVHKAMKNEYKKPEDVPGWRYTDAHGVFTGERNPPPEGLVLDPVEPMKPSRPRQKRGVEDDEYEYNSKTKKAARIEEYDWNSPGNTYNAGGENGYNTRQDMHQAQYTPLA